MQERHVVTHEYVYESDKPHELKPPAPGARLITSTVDVEVRKVADYNRPNSSYPESHRHVHVYCVWAVPG